MLLQKLCFQHFVLDIFVKLVNFCPVRESARAVRSEERARFRHRQQGKTFTMRRTNTLLILVLVFGLGMLVSTVVHLGNHSGQGDQFALQEPEQVLPVSQ